MTTTYFKTSDPAVLAAWDDFYKVAYQARIENEAFAKSFGGIPFVRNDFMGYQFAGLRFDPAKVSPLWTKRDKGTAFQRPLAGLKGGATPEEKIALKELRDRWIAEFPKTKASRDELLKAMGADWGDFIFSGPAGLFRHGDVVFISCGVKLDSRVMTEIMASEYAHEFALFKKEGA